MSILHDLSELKQRDLGVLRFGFDIGSKLVDWVFSLKSFKNADFKLLEQVNDSLFNKFVVLDIGFEAEMNLIYIDSALIVPIDI